MFEAGAVHATAEQPASVVVFVDTHLCLGRPLCTELALSRAISEEVCQEAEAAPRSGWNLFGSSTAPSREELRARAAALTAAVLSGARSPPGGLLRTVDAIAQELQLVHAQDSACASLSCKLFGDSATQELSSQETSPGRLALAWDSSDNSSAPSLGTMLSDVGACSKATAVLVFSGRPMPASFLSAHTDHLQSRLFWIHCGGLEPQDLSELSGICEAHGGAAASASSKEELRHAIGNVLRVLKFAHASDSSSSASHVQDHRTDTRHVPAQQATGVASVHQRAEVLPSSMLTFAGKLFASVPTSAWTGYAGAAPQEAEATEAVLRSVQANSDLEKMTPEARRARIRDLVAEEVRRRQAPRSPLAAAMGPALDMSRSVEQRILLEWLLVLARALAFSGDITTLAHASSVSRLWRDALKPSGSELARRLWKCIVRFGAPVPRSRRWALWNCLLAHHSSKVFTPASRNSLVVDAPDDYESQVACGRSDESLAEARYAISADLPRTFDPERGRGTRLLQGIADREEAHCNLSQQQEALERILLSVAARDPAVGYCQGLDVVAAFVFSVALEEGLAPKMAEAQSADFLVRLLSLGDLRSWLEPPLAGLRAAGGALAVLLDMHCPRLAAHLATEGASVDLLSLSWLQMLFTGLVPLPRAALCRIWECWLLDGSPKVFFRISLALLSRAEGTLLEMPIESVSEMLQTFPPPLDDQLDTDRLIAAAWATKVTNSVLKRAKSAAAEKLVARHDCERGAPSQATEAKTKEAGAVAGRQDAAERKPTVTDAGAARRGRG
eukprot:TRINITY_DN20301_c0_g1_i2.p1 TRINITY_DN20301_c0_g1~~TRINITY_DN20301_c0_g1_i2.p1  ORF type:complete len:788 (+),score=139.65 TRINITY_DN20301_c0_g1_i2:136-2499(+)